MHKAAFAGKEQLAGDIWTYFFDRPAGFSYLAGQYVEIAMTHKPVDNRGIRRTFTLSSSPTEKLLAITLDFPENNSSYKLALKNLRPGDEVTIGEPMGDLVLPIDATRPLIFIAGGLGIASYRGMLKLLLDSNQPRVVELHYALRDIKQKIYSDFLIKSCAKLTHYHSPGQRLDVRYITSGKPAEALYFVSGSEHFVTQIKDNLLSRGVLSTAIAFDYFDGYTEL